MNILVTGGAGFIGSHTCIELFNAGHQIIIIDNLINSKQEALTRVEKITNKKIIFYQNDLLDKNAVSTVFKKHSIDAVIHFAGLKAVGESGKEPLKYFHNNVTGTVILCQEMQKHNVKNLIFSSSATVYGSPKELPIQENFPTSATNPYGRSKLIIEEILQDLYISDQNWNIVLLRYFNPIGAHPSGLIGEDPNDIPNNLLPYISQVAIGKLPCLNVFGNDYKTPDGTGVRDYIHVVDLAIGHVKALKKIKDQSGLSVYNLGTGEGYSVFEVLHAFEKASDKTIPYKILPRRKGDIAQCYADPSKAKKELEWEAILNINEMVRDTWNWQSKNPNGYDKK